MKILKNLFSAFAIVAFFATGVLAQGQASITASANVVTDVTLSGDQNLDFGTMTDTEADGGVSVALATAAVADLGKFTLSAVANTQDIILTISAPDILSPTGTPNFQTATPDDLPLDLEATYTENEADVEDGTNDFGFNGTSTSGEASVSTTATTAYVYVGGTVGGAPGDYQGQYSGDITLSVYYD